MIRRTSESRAAVADVRSGSETPLRGAGVRLPPIR